MGVSHAFVSAAPPVADPTKVGSNEWNAPHVINIVNADIDPAAAIDESKLNLNFPTHAALTLGVVSSGLSLAGQVLSLGLASSGVTGALSGTDWDTFNNKQSALTFPLSPALGGTGVNNGANTLTVPATGTAALLAVDNAFTGSNTFTRGTAANNLFLGGAGNTTTTGDNNVCFGSSSGGALTGGNGNLLLGKGSGTSLTSGENNTFIGYNSGTNITTTSNNIIIGADQRGQAGDAAKLYIHPGNVSIPMIYGDFAQSYFQLNSRGTSTNVVRSILQLRAVVTTGSTGGAAGLGVASDYYAETATDGTYQLQGRVNTAWVDATNATRKAKMSLSAYDTAARLGLEIEASGSAAKLGFFGVTSVVQPANNVAIDTLLSNLGLRASGGESFFDTRLMLPMGEISYFDMTGTTITIAAQSDGSTNMVKATPTTTLNNDKEFDNGGANNGRLRYTGTTTRTFHVACTISIAPASANDTFVFGVAKNGTVIAASKVLIQATTASGIRSAAMHVMVSLATNEYLELFVGNTTDTDDCTVHSLNLFAMGM